MKPPQDGRAMKPQRVCESCGLPVRRGRRRVRCKDHRCTTPARLYSRLCCGDEEQCGVCYGLDYWIRAGHTRS